MPPAREIRANEQSYTDRIQEINSKLFSGIRYHTIKLPDGSLLPGLQDIGHLEYRLSCFELPEDLTGKRVLDIGTWDGWFAFEMERRGAEVVAVDCADFKTFREAKRLLRSRVDYRVLDMDELSPAVLGKFDIVLFLGVLYHLRHPLLGLERVVSLTTDVACIESFVIPYERDATGRARRLLEFYETVDLGGQLDNWYGPTADCLMAMCRAAGFAEVELKSDLDQRASVVCKRRWRAAAIQTGSKPLLMTAINSREFSAYFHSGKDEYLGCFFQTEEPDLDRSEIFVEIGGFGTPCLLLIQTDASKWQANCIRTPGLEPGVHRVRLRVRSTGYSNEVSIYVDRDKGFDDLLSKHEAPPELIAVEYVSSADSRYARMDRLTISFRTARRNLTARDVSVEAIGAGTCEAQTLVLMGDYWRVDTHVPDGLDLAKTCVRVRTSGSGYSEAGAITAA